MLALALCGSVSVVANEEVSADVTTVLEEVQPAATRAMTERIDEAGFDAANELTRTIAVIGEIQAATEEGVAAAQEEVAVIE